MRRLRQKSPDTYIPRGKKNIPEDTDWKAFISKSEKTKELMTKRNPEVAKRITKMIEEENLEKAKKKKNEQDYFSDQCTCKHEFDNCKFCQGQDSGSEDNEEVYKLPDLTIEELREYDRQSLEEWKQVQKKRLKEERKEKYILLKKKLLTPIIMPETVKSQYEKIRDEIIAQRKKEWLELEKQWDKSDGGH